MPYGIYQPRRWKQQPRGPVGIDWSHSSARGLDLLVNAVGPAAVLASQRSQRVLQFENVFNPSASPTITASPWGAAVALRDARANPADFGVVTAANNTTPLTMLVATRQVGLAGAGSVPVFGRGQDGSGSGWNVAINFEESGGQRLSANAVYTDGGAAGYSATDTVSVVNRWVIAAAVFVPFDGFKLYIDGRLGASYTNATKGTFRGSTKGYLLGGNAGGQEAFSNRQAMGDFALFAAWTRALPEAEVVELSRNPWQIFRPLRPIIYSLPSASAVPTLSAATAVNITSSSAQPRVTVTF